MNSTQHQHPQRLFVLDTNVLMHDPTALFRFQEHDVFLPMVVLEELDQHKDRYAVDDSEFPLIDSQWMTELFQESAGKA